MLRHIEYLLSLHDCVVIPGLGAILATRCPARYNEVTGMYYAPYRRFTFNVSLVESDGLLTMSVARALSLDYNEAALRVESEVADLKAILNRTGELGIGRVGRIELSETGQPRFVAYNRDRISPLVNWLGVLELPTADSVDHRRYHHIYPHSARQSRTSRIQRFFRSAVGAAAAILIALIASTPISVKNTYTASTSLPAITSPKPAEVPVVEKEDTQTESIAPDDEIKKTSVKDNSDETVFKTETNNTVAQEAEVVPVKDVTEKVSETVRIEKSVTKQEATTPAPLRFDDNDSFIVVVGSLYSAEDAEKFISQQSRYCPGVNFGIVEQGNHFRVYAATGSSKSEAQQQLKNPAIAKVFKGSWVTSK